MKKLFLLMIFCSLFFCSYSQIITGKKISEMPNTHLTDSSISLLTESAQFEDAKVLLINSIFYEAIFTQSGVIKYISTSDQKFKTNEGVRVGDTYLELKKKSKYSTRVINLPGWGKCVKLKSGWNAVFDFKKSISNKSKVLFFYQRKHN